MFKEEDRLIQYDPDILATLPRILEPLDPLVEATKDVLVGLHNTIGVPWWAVLGVACLVTRTSLLPILY